MTKTMKVAGSALALALLSAAAAPAAASPLLSGDAYMEQIGAPANWATNAGFWLSDATALNAGAGSGSYLVTDPGNSAVQAVAGPSGAAFSFQYGLNNAAEQQVGGDANRAEIAQISTDTAWSQLAQVDAGARTADPRIELAAFAPTLGNSARQVQDGERNFARAVQIGRENVAFQSQDGAELTSLIFQSGQGNRADVRQSGMLNYAMVMQAGQGNGAFVSQAGEGAIALISQSGQGNFASIRQ